MILAVHYLDGTLERATRAAVATEERLYPKTFSEVLWRPARPGEAFDYYASLRDLWRRGEPFCNLEGDVVPWPGALTELATCPEPWCGFGAFYSGTVIFTGLACQHYGARFLEALPELWEQRPVDYASMDGWLNKYAETRGWRERHVHSPPVAHVNFKQLGL